MPNVAVAICLRLCFQMDHWIFVINTEQHVQVCTKSEMPLVLYGQCNLSSQMNGFWNNIWIRAPSGLFVHGCCIHFMPELFDRNDLVCQNFTGAFFLLFPRNLLDRDTFSKSDPRKYISFYNNSTCFVKGLLAVQCSKYMVIYGYWFNLLCMRYIAHTHTHTYINFPGSPKSPGPVLSVPDTSSQVLCLPHTSVILLLSALCNLSTLLFLPSSLKRMHIICITMWQIFFTII